jgi:hypothetical protein
MTEKRQTSQGYIIRILQHFATKLRNITNFVMLFQAVMKFCLDQNFSYKGEGPLVGIRNPVQAPHDTEFCSKTSNIKIQSQYICLAETFMIFKI